MLNTNYNNHKFYFRTKNILPRVASTKKAVSHPECGPQIGFGSVILLKEVVVFKLNPNKLYLNITLRNIFKVSYLIIYSLIWGLVIIDI